MAVALGHHKGEEDSENSLLGGTAGSYGQLSRVRRTHKGCQPASSEPQSSVDRGQPVGFPPLRESSYTVPICLPALLLKGMNHLFLLTMGFAPFLHSDVLYLTSEFFHFYQSYTCT